MLFKQQHSSITHKCFKRSIFLLISADDYICEWCFCVDAWRQYPYLHCSPSPGALSTHANLTSRQSTYPVAQSSVLLQFKPKLNTRRLNMKNYFQITNSGILLATTHKPFPFYFDHFSLCSVYVMYIYLISLMGRQLALTQLKHNQCSRQSIFLPQCPIHLASNIFLISSVYISKSFSNCAADP